jgi:CRISPR-associated endonuclease/helicase Cas3
MLRMTALKSFHELILWPGKSPAFTDGPFHPAAYHMLDVAAVADGLMAAWPLGLSPTERDAICLLVALHDLGKFNPHFRAMIMHGTDQGMWRHWEVSEAYLWHDPIEDILSEHLGCTFRTLRPLTSAVAGHHGKPSKAYKIDQVLKFAGADGIQAATTCVQIFCQLWPSASLSNFTALQAREISWWLSGLTVTADWIGSNFDWFKPMKADANLTLAAYQQIARERAARALQKTGILAPTPANKILFEFALRPMQKAATSIALPNAPMLAIIEDETGAGKTEAALILAQRMLLAGRAQGIYVALPTTATADAMFSRLHRVIEQLFVSPPSLALAHGRAALSESFRQLRDRSRASDDVVCGEWIGDNRRRALLANVGIGTIDQALLAVLPTKFATLRVWGLASKLLIVDEVHELGEPYLEQELAQLLRLHAMNGGSAILITATLPLGLRQKLANAFEQGAGRASQPNASPAYPSLSIVGGSSIRDFSAELSAKGAVKINRLADVETALNLLTDSALKGAACVWVRNSVDDAIAAVEALRRRGLTTTLLHARYTLHDRKRNESALHSYFSRDGLNRHLPDGTGRVLVGTQVLESSLDLDFDVMISDLAPMAALIQRAGRLWRHMQIRPAASRPVPGPILHVLSPHPAEVTTERWLNALQPGGAWVYPLADQWRTADILFRVGEIVAPAGLRALIEAVHGDTCGDIPPVLNNAENKALGEASSKAGLARQNCVPLDKGYRDGGGGDDDRKYPTRLGQETRTLLLVREDTGELLPWATQANYALSRIELESLSEVSIGVTRLRGLTLPDQKSSMIVKFTKDWPDWRRTSVTVCPVAANGAICDGLSYKADLGLMLNSLHLQG